MRIMYIYILQIFLFKIFNKKIIDVEVPVLLGFSGTDIIVSGIEFAGSGILPKTFII